MKFGIEMKEEIDISDALDKCVGCSDESFYYRFKCDRIEYFAPGGLRA